LKNCRWMDAFWILEKIGHQIRIFPPKEACHLNRKIPQFRLWSIFITELFPGMKTKSHLQWDMKPDIHEFHEVSHLLQCELLGLATHEMKWQFSRLVLETADKSTPHPRLQLTQE
jgi:hypothetical protein